MKILLAGPTETASLASVLGDISGLPPATVATPVNVLAVEYIRQGHEVCLVTLDKSISERVSVSRNGLTVVYLPHRLRARHFALTMFEREIRLTTKEFREAQPDIVHAHWTYEFAEAGVRAGIPLLVTAHDAAWRSAWLFADAYRFIRLLMTLRTLPRVSNLTVVSPYLRRHMALEGFFGRVDVIPNGLDLVEWPFTPKRPPGTGAIIAAIGNSAFQKNMDAAASAFGVIRKKLPGAQLHLFGPTLEHYRGIDGVTVHGAVPNNILRDFHRDHTHLLIHPSFQESCPVSIMEAKATGIPAVAGRRSGGVPYVMGEANPGLVDVRKPEEIASRAVDILSSPSLYERLSKEGRADVERRFDIRVVAREYLKLYEGILARAG